MKSGNYIVSVFAVGFCLIGYLFFVVPESAAAQLPLILAAMGTAIAVLSKLGETDLKVATVEQKVEKSTAVSEENRQVLAVVSQQTGHALEQMSQELTVNTKTTEATQETVEVIHALSNSHNDALEAKIGGLEQRLELALGVINRYIGEQQVKPLVENEVHRVVEQQVVPIVETVIAQHKEEGHQ